MKPFYFYIGGAYGEYSWTSLKQPSADQWESWHCGELIIVKISGSRAYVPLRKNEWQLAKRNDEG